MLGCVQGECFCRVSLYLILKPCSLASCQTASTSRPFISTTTRRISDDARFGLRFAGSHISAGVD
jgi:hypothetical protein